MITIDEKLNDILNRNTPKISVIMPTYCRNKSGLLSRCIDSVLNQTFSDFEFIIIDDGSVDGSEKVIRDFANIDERIIYIRHDTNSGLPAIRVNEGILKSKGHYISFMFDDNIWKLDALEVLYIAMQSDPCDIYCAQTSLIFSNQEKYILGKCPIIEPLISNFNMIANGSILCTKDFFVKYGLYDPHVSMTRLCDWELWLRSFKLGAKFGQIDKCISTEYGPSSKDSIGRSINLDYKITLAYMTDELFFKEKADILSVEKYADYDILDHSRLFKYFKNIYEYNKYLENIIRPYFKKIEEKPLFKFEKNDIDQISYCDRKRILIVSNMVGDYIKQIKRLIKSDENIIVTCSEWQLDLFDETELDSVLIFSCNTRFTKSKVRLFRMSGVNIVDMSKRIKNQNFSNYISECVSEQIGYKICFEKEKECNYNDFKKKFDEKENKLNNICIKNIMIKILKFDTMISKLMLLSKSNNKKKVVFKILNIKLFRG